MGPHMDLGQLNEFVYKLHYKQEAHMKWADELASVVTFNAQYAEGTYRGAGELGSKVENIRIDHNKTKDEMTQMKEQLAKNDEQVKDAVVKHMVVHESERKYMGGHALGGSFCYSVLLFGTRLGPLLWGRLAALIMRITAAMNSDTKSRFLSRSSARPAGLDSGRSSAPDMYSGGSFARSR